MLSLLYNDKNTNTEINGVGFHKIILNMVPYFNCVHTYQDSLEFKMSVETTKLFKKWLYEQEIDKNELNLEIGIEIHNISDFLDIKFYTHIKNKLFVYVLETNNPDIQFKYFLYFYSYDIRFKFGEYHVSTLNKESYHYAYCLHFKIGCIENKEEAFRLYEKNFENSYSLHNYAWCFEKGLGCIKDEKKAFELYELNCIKNKNIDSLHNYATCFYNGTGCIKDEKKAFELYEFNWKENKNSESLHNYAYCIQNGKGCEKDEKKDVNYMK